MKRAFSILFFILSAICINAEDFKAQWTSTNEKYLAPEGPWLTKNIYLCDAAKAAKGSGEYAVMTLEAKAPVFGTFKTFPTVTNLKKDDCVVFTIPGVNLKKGDKVTFSSWFGVRVKAGESIRWKCEILEGKKWKEADNKEYSFHCYTTKPLNETYYIHTFTLRQNCKGELKIRCRILDEISGEKEYVYFSGRGTTPFCTITGTSADVKDLTRVLLIGNSFTFQRNIPHILQSIALSQGHELEYGVNLKGGMDFTGHLKLPLTVDAIAEGGYQVAFLQDQSACACKYAVDPEKYAQILTGSISIATAVREKSPRCRMILERTWSFAGKDGKYNGFSGFEEFDAKLVEGSEKIAKEIKAEISPIGDAFIRVRAAGMNPYYSDNKHQSLLGAYQKACVNYMMLFGDFTAPVPTCGLSPEEAAKCQAIARSIVR